MIAHLLARFAEHAGPLCREGADHLVAFLLSPLGGWTVSAVGDLWGRS